MDIKLVASQRQLEKTRDGLSTQLNTAQQQVKEMNDKIIAAQCQLQQTLDEWKNSSEQHHSQQQQKDVELMKFKQKLETCETQLHTSQQHQQKLERDVKQHQLICDQLEAQIDALKKEKKEYEKCITNMENELTSLQQQYIIISSQLTETKEQLECTACFAMERMVVCLPCGHISMCRTCHDGHVARNNTCAMCRVEITAAHDVKIA